MFICRCEDNYNKKVVIDGMQYLLTSWNTCGLDGYSRLRPLAYPGVRLVFGEMNPTCTVKTLIDSQKYHVLTGIHLVITSYISDWYRVLCICGFTKMVMIFFTTW